MATVERGHREKACEVLLMGVSDQVLHYIDTGETPDSDLDEDGICDGVHGVAQAIADAEQRGREIERADVISWLRGVGDQYMNGDMVPCDEFTGEAYRQAANEIEQGRHAAARQQGGG